MASSRIFVRGLPPSLSEDEFRQHFSAKQTITDAKLISHRRIGYVGYKSPEEAEKAVKYFNRSFIRMSRIAAEIARPISDTTLPLSRKAQREQAKESQKVEKPVNDPSPNTGSLLKRKRSDVDESDPKLKEFLEVMRPKSNSKTWAARESLEQAFEEPPKKLQAIAIPEAESDAEYEMVPKKSKVIDSLVSAVNKVDIVSVTETASQQPTSTEELSLSVNPIVGLDATDDDWLRSRTNRLLDLVEPINTVSTDPSTSPQSPELPSERLEQEDVNPENQDSIPDRRIETECEAEPVHGQPDLTIAEIQSNGRLFIRNLAYLATEDDLRKHFAVYGSLEEVHLPLDAVGNSKGFALIQFENPSEAVEAYHNIDGEPFQGRLLHILPAAPKREKKLDEFEVAKLPLKKQKLIKKKAEASTTTFNWNSLYMNQDAVNSSIADRLGVSKAELLDPTSADAGIKQAIAETSIIQETKTYFTNNGVDLASFKKKERGDTTILVKNFPYGMSIEGLRKLFEEFGQVLRVLMPPAGTIAIVEFAQSPQARAAFASLAYRRMKDSVLFLEKAPKDMFTGASGNELLQSRRDTDSAGPKISAADLLEKEADVAAGDTSTLFVKNLSFNTTSSRLTELFKPLGGFMSARVNTKTDPKKPGQALSMGFGFVEFRSKTQAQAALAAMNGHALDEHKLVIKASHKGLDAAEDRRREDRSKKMASKCTKIIIKNLPFEASKKDVRTLFGTYGQLRSVRVPKKFNHSARGFAFADFVTAREAENALEALGDTHLLGRRLVLEFAAEDVLDAEEEIEKMQKKVGRQVDKVALQKLTGRDRKKFNIEGNDNDDDQ